MVIIHARAHNNSSVHCVVAGWIPGWGHKGQEPGPNINNEMKEVELPVVTNEECNKWLEDSRYPGGRVNDLQICTRNPKGKGWCLFDGGAPLFLIKNESYMIQIGLASVRAFTARPPCGQEGFMSVYTRISKYLGWIHRRISGCGNHPFYNHSGILDEYYFDLDDHVRTNEEIAA